MTGPTGERTSSMAPLSAEEPLPRRDLPRLTSLRAFAALAVLGYHLARHTDWLPREYLARYGFAGVGFFFILSGFVLAWSMRPHDSAAEFWVRRVARVYPSHVVMLGVAVVAPVVAFPLTWLGGLASLFLVQAWFVSWDVVFALNAVSWSLACEAFFYAGAPFVIHRLASWSTARACVVAGSWVALTASAAIVLGLAGTRADVYAYTNPLIRSGEFVLGVLLAVLVQAGWRPRAPFAPTLVLLVAAVVVVSVRSGTAPQSVVDVVLTPFFAATILTAALADLRGRAGLLGHRWLTYCGEVSFAFYLVHELVILNLAPHLPGTSVAERLGSLAVVVGAACLAAALLHHVVERPAQRRIRAAWLRHRTRRTAIR